MDKTNFYPEFKRYIVKNVTTGKEDCFDDYFEALEHLASTRRAYNQCEVQMLVEIKA